MSCQISRLDTFSDTFLINPIEANKQAEWQVSVNEPAMLWAFNMISRSHKKGAKIDIDLSDKNSQIDLWKMGTGAGVS